MHNVIYYTRSMGRLGENIRKLREDKGLSSRDLARLSGISNEYIYKIEKGEVSNIGSEKLIAISEILNVTPNDLLNYSETDDDDDFAGPEIPIVGFVNAGRSEICFDDMGFPTGRGIGSVQRPRELLNDYHAFAVVARGDSMSPRIDDGEVVVAAPTKQILPNKEAVIRLKNDEIYLKYVKEQSNMYILMSENSAYEPIIVKKSDIKFIYRVYVIYPGDYKRFLK